MAHNFTLGGLGFHKLINDEHPYERATAPFRKEQLDTAPVVGDQSLSGWWTRGQMSFHRGAGLKYYEVLDGDEVSYRYDTSSLVEPFEPGELTLSGTINSSVSGTAFMCMVGTSGSAARVCTTGGSVYDFSTGSTLGTAKTLPSSTAQRWLAYDAGRDVHYSLSWFRIDTAVGTSTSTYTTLWTNGATAWSKMWFAKNRLWIVDVDGTWFTLAGSGAGGAATGTDVFWTSGLDDTDDTANLSPVWSFAESPSVVYLAHGNKIFSVQLDDTGAVPIIDTPTVAAILPTGERIGAITWYLGRLAIATSEGLRIAEQRSDGSLVYGSLVIEGTFSRARTMSGWGDLLYVLGETSVGFAALYAVNMADNADDLIPAYAPIRTGIAHSGSAYTGTYANKYGGLVYHGSGIIAHRDSNPTLEATGSVTTAFHRMGTLDAKAFRHLRVKVEGEGTVQVQAYIAPDTGGYSLGTITAPATVDLDMPAAIASTPTEAIAFRFTLNRATTTTGPTLLGYQLKALPMPKRQRLIRVPLMMFDTERGPTGRALGAEKSAWTRYRALEALEESNALVSFTDADTGDSGTAYIESVELMQRNGSKGVSRSNGFGGVVTVTLRKVA